MLLGKLWCDLHFSNRGRGGRAIDILSGLRFGIDVSATPLWITRPYSGFSVFESAYRRKGFWSDVVKGSPRQWSESHLAWTVSLRSPELVILSCEMGDRVFITYWPLLPYLQMLVLHGDVWVELWPLDLHCYYDVIENWLLGSACFLISFDLQHFDKLIMVISRTDNYAVLGYWENSDEFMERLEIH